MKTLSLDDDYTVVLTESEVKFLQKMVHKVAMSIPPDEFSDWIADEIPEDQVMDFYYTFVYPANQA